MNRDAQAIPSPLKRPGPDEREYLLRRAEDHRLLAERTDASDARTIHLQLSQLYAERAAGIDMVDTDQAFAQEDQERVFPRPVDASGPAASGAAAVEDRR